MTIFGIEGGIGTGKTSTGIYMLITDLKKGRKVLTNARLKGLTKKEMQRVTYLTKESIGDIFQNVKDGVFDLHNSTIFIQEAHNYVDSRNSASKKNKLFSYFILQSRHAGQETCDIIYDTQELTQVDKRLRNNTDHILHPYIIGREVKTGKPTHIEVQGVCKYGHKWVKYKRILDIRKTIDNYDTHELVDFEV